MDCEKLLQFIQKPSYHENGVTLLEFGAIGNRMTIAELKGAITDPGTCLVDIRSVDAYNGWKLNNERRGGHIPSARSLPAKWLQYIDWIEIVRNKGILPEQKVIVYGYDKASIDRVAEKFRKTGYSSVHEYYDFLSDWIQDDTHTLEGLPGYRQLVSAEWLKGLLETGTAEEYSNDRSVLCHAHYRNRGAYEEGHIPGAIDLDTNTLESPETWNRRPAAELKETLEELGIRHDTTAILYGRFSFPDTADPFPGSSAGHLGSIRAACIMMYAGVQDVRILNGGLQSWIDSGYATTTVDSAAQPVEEFGAEIPGRPEIIIDIEQAKEILKNPEGNLVSVRSWSEYTGERSGYNYIKKKGRIPGSTFGNCGSDAYHMENYRNLDHTCREYHEIAAQLAAAGVTPDKKNAFYCGTGWRGSEAWLNTWLMGWPDVSVFDGGWFEWSNDPNNPCETGIPEG